MTDRELMQEVLQVLEFNDFMRGSKPNVAKLIAALRERLAQPEQESVKFCTYPKCQTTAGCAGVCARQNTTPQPRQWVGLTDEEIDYQAKKDDHAVYFALGALWAEAKLKEKNQ